MQGVGFRIRQEHNGTVPTSTAMKRAQFTALAGLTVLLDVCLSSCTRRPADTAEANHDKALTNARSAWEAGIQARARAAVPEPACDRAKPPGLIEAARFGDAKLVRSLLAGRVDRRLLNEALLVASISLPLVVDDTGRETKALDLPYTEIAKMLLNKGASIEARDEYGQTPLISAALKGNSALVKLLLDEGAKMEATDFQGGTALIAAACNCPFIDMPDTSDSMRELLKRGANINARTQKGGTALMAAARWGRDHHLRILLDAGADIEAHDNDGNTSLLIAAEGSAYPTADAVAVLLARGANVEARNNNGETALMLSAGFLGSEDGKIIKMLLMRGCDVGAQDNNGRTALDRAIKKGRPDAISLLRAALRRG